MNAVHQLKVKKIRSLKEIYQNRKKVLIFRDKGGLGDIFMHRMLFEDIKILMPDAETYFACPEQFHAAVEDHPFIDHIINCNNVDESDFGIIYNTSTECHRYEMQKAPNCDKHRSDIWAYFCGFQLTKHDMHFNIRDEEKAWARQKLKQHSNKQTILISPVTAMVGKNLSPEQINPVIEELSKNYFVVLSHNKPLPDYNAVCFHGYGIRHLMALVDSVDYVISPDTSVFHLAGGLGKPMVAVFGWADGKIYSKHFKNVELVQHHRDEDPSWCGPCYNWGCCVKDQKSSRKPCIKEISAEDIIKAFKILKNKLN